MLTQERVTMYCTAAIALLLVFTAGIVTTSITAGTRNVVLMLDIVGVVFFAIAGIAFIATSKMKHWLAKTVWLLTGCTFGLFGVLFTHF